MPRKMIDLTGRKFGRLTVIENAGRDRHRCVLWRCRCECGCETIVTSSHLISGFTKSCGCYRREVTRDRKTIHGHRYERLYGIWKNMKSRCNNPDDSHYGSYGERGIFVCDEWENSYDNFSEWAVNNGYDDELTIDRINNDDGYYPDNCRWADRFVQANNKQTSRYVTYNDVTHTISVWSRLFNIHRGILRRHILNGDMHDFEEYFAKNEK